MDDSVVSLLKEMRYGDGTVTKRARKRKVNVAPGKSVQASDVSQDEEEAEIQEAEESELNVEDVVDSEEDDSVSDAESEPRTEVTIDRKKLRGVLPVNEGDLDINMYVVVNFAPLSGKSRKLYIGKIEQMLGGGEFEAVFLRPSQKSTGSSFVYPENEDRSVISFNQIMGKTSRPEEVRRGILRFDVNSKEW